MPVTTPPTITALPTPPDPNDRSTFNSRAYPWSVAQQTLATEVGAVAANVYANAGDAATSAATASAASESAVAASNYKGPWSSLTGALAIPASVSHDGAVWALVSSVADVTAHTPGVSAQWLRLTAEIAPPAAAAAPGLVWLSTIVATGAATVDFTTEFTSEYDNYKLFISGLHGNGSRFYGISALLKKSGSFLTSGYETCRFNGYTGGLTIDLLTARSNFEIGKETSALAVTPANFEIDIQNVNSTEMRTLLFYHGSGADITPPSSYVFMGRGSQSTLGVLQELRIQCAGGSMHGTFAIYGVKD